MSQNTLKCHSFLMEKDISESVDTLNLNEQTFSSLEGVEERLKKCSKGNFKCEQCNKSYTTKWSLSQHIQSFHDGVTYPCEKCDDSKNLKSHIRYTHDGVHVHEGVKYNCERCDYTTKNKYALKSHNFSVHNCNTILDYNVTLL